MLGNILYFVLTLGILIAFHEWGHFQVARWCGVRVIRFSIGFGKPLLRWTDRHQTEFVVAAIPLGGYVKMLDGREGNVSAEQMPYAFNEKSLGQKAAIIAAGPIANFLLAFLVYWIVSLLGVQGLAPKIGTVTPESAAYSAGIQSDAWIKAIDGNTVTSRADAHIALVQRIGDTGVIEFTTASSNSDVAALDNYRISIERWLEGQKDPDIYQSLGFRYWYPVGEPRVSEVVEGGAAAAAGMLADDIIIAVDTEFVDDWSAVVESIKDKAGSTVVITVERLIAGENRQIDIDVSVEAFELESGEAIGRIGVVGAAAAYPDEMHVLQQSGLVSGFGFAWQKTYDMTALTLESIAKMVTGLISPSNLSGPITIARVAADTADSGLVSYMQFLALLSISLGVLNLLPVPMLDGGQLTLLGYEAVVRRPVPDKVQLGMQQLGLLIILSLMTFALFNDFSRLM